MRVDPDDAPPDPVQRGTCTAILNLTSDVDGKPFCTACDLWRLNAPGNKHWKRGDQKQDRGHSLEGRAEFRDLPAGWYRVHPLGVRQGGTDPSAFWVSGAETVVNRNVMAPRRKPVFLKVYDERGVLMTEGTRIWSDGGSTSHGPARPKWRKPRRLRHGNLNGMTAWTGIGCGAGSIEEIPLVSDERGFTIGRFPESTRYRSYHTSVDVGFRGRSSVSTYLGSDAVLEKTFIGVCVPLEMVSERIRMPDGERAIDAGATIEVNCRSVLEEKRMIDRPWEDIPIRVRVQCKGYMSHGFQFTLREGPGEMTLQPPMQEGR